MGFVGKATEDGGAGQEEIEGKWGPQLLVVEVEAMETKGRMVEALLELHL